MPIHQMILDGNKGEHDTESVRPLKRLDDWFNGRFETQLNEAKALQQYSQKTIGRIGYDPMEVFDKQITAGITSKASETKDDTNRRCLFSSEKKREVKYPRANTDGMQ